MEVFFVKRFLIECTFYSLYRNNDTSLSCAGILVNEGNCEKSAYLSIFGVDSGSDSVNLLVHLSSVMVTFLTSTGYGERYTRRMPRSNTSNFTKTLVRFAGQLLCVPTRSNTYKIKMTKINKMKFGVNILKELKFVQ